MELNQFFNLPLTICSFLSRNISIYLIIPSLLYHVFVYIYLGIKSGGSDFYYGFMYSFNYAGAIVAYWIILYQSKNVFNNSNILSKELLYNQNSETDETNETNETIEIIELNQVECKICCFSSCDCSYKSTYFQLMKNNMNELSNFDKSDKEFRLYCKNWDKYMKIILIVWNGIALINIILRAIPNEILEFPNSFDNHPLALYGYYNLFGQFIASTLIVTAAVIMLCGFFQVKCLIIGYAIHMRKYRIENNLSNLSDNNEIYNIESSRYIKIQQTILALSELWSYPVIVSLFFCTQVAISNICVIHYELKECTELNTCDFNLAFPIIWLLAALYIIYILTFTMSSINVATNVLKDIFIYSNDGDYKKINGRKHWLEYLESNPIKFQIYGIVVTPTLVTNTIYTLGTAISSFLVSNLFNK
jgi:hypothetical protein